MDKMSLIVLQKLGHVLGAFTRTADDATDLKAKDVVGEELLVRDEATGDTLVRIPEQHLEVKPADRRDDVILAHRRYVLVDGLPEEKPSVTAAPAWIAGVLTITLPSPPANDGKAWVEIDNGQTEPTILTIDLTTAASTGTAPVTLSNGEYGILVAAPGYRAYVGHLTVP